MSIYIEDRLTGAKLRTLAPISQNTFSDDDLIIAANDELLVKIVSDLMGVREDFFLSEKSISIVAGIDRYTIPTRAIGNTLVALYYVDTAQRHILLDRIDASRLGDYAGLSTDPEKFYLSGDEVVICPSPATATGTLKFLYHRKPNRLIATSSCAKITAIDTVAGVTTFTVNTDLSASLQVGSQVDVVSVKSPYLLWASEVPLQAISTTQMQVSASLISNAVGTIEPQVGDYICPTGFSNIPMIPEEFHPVLDQMLAVRLLAALGDLNKWNAAKAELKEVREEAVSMIKNRVQSSPQRVSARNGLLSAFQR